MNAPRIFADFHNADTEGRLRLFGVPGGPAGLAPAAGAYLNESRT